MHCTDFDQGRDLSYCKPEPAGNSLLPSGNVGVQGNLTSNMPGWVAAFCLRYHTACFREMQSRQRCRLFIAFCPMCRPDVACAGSPEAPRQARTPSANKTRRQAHNQQRKALHIVQQRLGVCTGAGSLARSSYYSHIHTDGAKIFVEPHQTTAYQASAGLPSTPAARTVSNHLLAPCEP